MPSDEATDAEAPRRKPAKAAERLRRMLVVVPYLVRHPGVPLAEVSRLFDVAEEDLTEDLDLLLVSGLPPYSPGDLIGVDIEDGCVWIEFADHFSRPLRLSRNEARDLYLRAKALSATPGLEESAALDSALAKLADSLGPEAIGELAERVEAAETGRPAATLDSVRRAIAERERIEIAYHAVSTAETTVRRVDPEEVFHAIGNWYVVAWDHLSGEERLFRADRIREVAATGERFEPRGLAGAGRPLYTPTPEDVTVTLRLGPGARWVAEYYPTQRVEETGDGSLEVELRASRLEWVARLLLRVGTEAQVIGPDLLKDRVKALAGPTRERYQVTSPVIAPPA